MISISKAKPEDAQQIQEVFYKTFLQIYPNKEIGVTTEDVEEMNKNKITEDGVQSRAKQIESLPQNVLFLVAKDGPRVVGVFGAVVREECNQLQSIYILPEYQNKGIGKMFWNEALPFFNKDKDIVVHVATYNNQAIHFYKKLGFVDTNKRFTEERHRMPLSGVLIPEMELIIKKKP